MIYLSNFKIMEKIIDKIIQQSSQSLTTWGLGYGHFSKIINRFKLKIGAEIGVAYGGHSESILKNTNIKKLYGVDPYKHTIGYKDKMNYPQDVFNELYKYTINRLSQFNERYQHIREYSKDAWSFIPGQIDFIYIDADHSYDGVCKDLCLWFSKTRDGGIIGGHDYMHPDFPGVQKAIDEFFNRFNWKVNYEGDNVWWVQKQKLNISFFIPAFNCADTIIESVNSIIDTNFNNGDEIIITNDGSTDNTEAVLNNLAGKHPFIKIINHKRNKGGAAARNTAIENAKHEILFCLDSDNILAPNSIRPLKNFLISKNADCAVFQKIYFFMDNINIIHKKIRYDCEQVTIEYCLCNNNTPPSSGNYMFTKKSWEKAGGYPEGNWLDTWGFGINQLISGAKMYTLPDTYYFHRRGHESYTIRELKKNNISLTALQILIPHLQLLSKRSEDYIMSKGRYDWLEKLNKHPLTLAKKQRNFDKKQIEIFKNNIKIYFPKLYNYYLKIKFNKKNKK